MDCVIKLSDASLNALIQEHSGRRCKPKEARLQSHCLLSALP